MPAIDTTSLTLLLAMGAALCAAFISGWLLHMMVPADLFWAVFLASAASAPAGLFAPWCCNRHQRQWGVVHTLNIFCATLLSILVSGALVILDRMVINKVPSHDLMTDEFVRTLIAVAGIGMALSLVCFLLHYTFVQQAAALRRLGRQLRRRCWWAPKAKLLLCDDLESVAPGECAVCLDALAALPEPRLQEAAKGPGHDVHAGLLKLPCGHIFHGDCADRWMAREVSCPMCRAPIGSLSRCTRICSRVPAALAGGESLSTAWPEVDSPALTAEVVVQAAGQPGDACEPSPPLPPTLAGSVPLGAACCDGVHTIVIEECDDKDQILQFVVALDNRGAPRTCSQNTRIIV